MTVQVPSSGDAQAHYWLGPLTRKEAQSVFDEYAAALSKQSQQVMAMNMSVSFLMEKFGVKPEEVAEWIKTRFVQERDAEHPNQPSSHVVQSA